IALDGRAEWVSSLAATAANEKLPLAFRARAVQTLGKLPARVSIDALIELSQKQKPLALECIKALGDHLPNGQVYPHEPDRALQELNRLVTGKARNAQRSA